MQENDNRKFSTIATKSSHCKLGLRGEEIADHYLQNLGWNILFKNFRSRWGEIDRIASFQQKLIFVEVKLRTKPEQVDFLPPLTGKKLSRLTKTIHYFMSKEGHFLEEALGIHEFSLDAILVDQNNVIEHFKDLNFSLSMRTF